jgi:DNA (cytosine-5)-methyltransferase 1
MSLKVGALFAGYGGIELALGSVLDTEPAWFSEFDKAPSAILGHHWPDVPNLGDVTKVDWAAVEPVDIITGGSPCQDLSHAGKRAGMKAGTRSGLWASMCDAIDIIRPRLVVWENVRGALSAEADSAVEPCPICVGDGGRVTLRALGRVLGDLAELGYDAWWYGLRAADVGAAHGRFRVFLFATPANAGRSGGLEALERDGRGTAGFDGASVPDESDRDALRAGSDGGLTLLPTPAVNDMGAAYTPETWDAWTERMKAEHGNGNGHGKSLNIEALRLLPTPTTVEGTGPGSHGTGGDNLRTVVDQLLPTPRATDGTKGGPNQRGSSGDLMLPSAVGRLLPTPEASRAGGTMEQHLERKRLADGGVRTAVTNLDVLAAGAQQQDWREYEAAIRRCEQAWGRPAPLPTEPGAKGQPRLSPTFVEWLMGLPEGHVTDPAIGISRNDQLKALGNGVVPQQCAAALRAFLADTAKERVA